MAARRLLLLSLLTLALPTAITSLPDNACFLNNQSCDLHDNVIATFSDIEDLTECRQLCQDEPRCNYISHFGSASYPLVSTCMLFAVCSGQHDSPDSTTEDAACWQLCSGPMESQVSDNLVQLITDVDDERDCYYSCRQDTRCTYYTFHKISDTLIPGACFLLSRLEEPLRPCDHCRTGAADCSKDQGIFLFSADGEVVERVLLNVSSSYTVAPIPLGACGDYNVIAVGGGSSGRYGGGGSGYIGWATVLDGPAGKRELLMKVGGQQEASVVTLWNEKVLVEAQAGGSTDSSGTGGAGYCGGGGYGDSIGGGGGTDGGSGQNSTNYPGGVGSGFNVTSIPVRGFTVSPGSGGITQADFGGGGGGLLVDGEGPPPPGSRGGQGYGAGGGGDNAAGNAGVIVVYYN